MVLAADADLGSYRATIRDCQGTVVATRTVRLDTGTHDFVVPVSGLLTLERVR